MSFVLELKSIDDLIVTKAVLRARDFYQLSNEDLSQIIGLSSPTISRLKAGNLIKVKTKSGEIALLFLRVFRSLDAWMGGHMDNERAWLKSHHKILGGVPLELMKKPDGLSRVVEYLDAIRGH